MDSVFAALAGKLISFWLTTGDYTINIVLQNEIWFANSMCVSFYMQPLKWKKRVGQIAESVFLFTSVLVFWLGCRNYSLDSCRDRKGKFYSNACICHLPSDLEAMPLSLLEAICNGACYLSSGIPECDDAQQVQMHSSGTNEYICSRYD